MTIEEQHDYCFCKKCGGYLEPHDVNCDECNEPSHRICQICFDKIAWREIHGVLECKGE